MDSDTTVNNNAELQGELTTANDLAELLNGNYRTVRKILGKMHSEGKIIEGSVIRANRKITAYYLDNTAKKSVQAELKAIRNGKKTIVNNRNAINNTNGIKVNNNSNIQQYESLYNTNANDITNVKLYEVMKENNELLNELQKVREELNRTQNQNVQLQADLYKAQADVKLIEDRRSAVEGDNSRLQQEVEKYTDDLRNKEKQLNQRNTIIIGLCAVILVAITVALTLAFIR